MTTTETKFELIDVIDLAVVPGEYVSCTERSEFTIFGVTVTAFHRYHAARLACSGRWDSRCECCNHVLRFCHVTQDESGEYHCHGGTCLAIETLGAESVTRLGYTKKIEQKASGGFCATFDVPAAFWDMPRSDRPQYARPWKGEGYGRKNAGRPVWKLSVWGDCFEQCLENCMALTLLLGRKL